MILSFNEFNALNESNNYEYNNEYSNGIDVIESLMTVIAKKGSITETQAYTFLDNVLKETGYELNDEVYENYSEWINDWTPFIDASVNESEDEMDLYLTRRAEMMLDENVMDKVKGAAKVVKDYGHSAKKRFGDAKGMSKAFGGKHPNLDGLKGSADTFSKKQKIGLGIGAAAGAAALGYGAYKGVKALKKRSADKKAAAAQQK